MTARLIMKMAVAEVRPVTDTVRVYRFEHPRRPHLPAFTPGAHVDVHLPDGKVRQYSLCGDPDNSTAYEIAVKREDDGRGASRWLHENLRVGSVVPVSAPRNNFPLADGARRHVFIAGGIGITPIVAMVTHLARRDLPFELHFCSRVARTAPFDASLKHLCGPERLFAYFSDSSSQAPARLDVAEILSKVEPGTHVYCCGPQRLTEAVRAAAVHWPEGSVHFEVFKPTLDENFNPEPFDVKLASTGKVLRIPANKSALEVLRAHGIALPASCELGLCGSCACGYREGVVIHRDSVLDLTARQNQMMLCVSRARVSVTLDI